MVLTLAIQQITEALRRFGVSDQCKDLLVIRIGPPHVRQGEIEQQMKNVVAGELSSMEKLRGVTDWGLVKKASNWNREKSLGLTYHLCSTIN